MNLHELTINKINNLPDALLSEVVDYIDFLNSKYKLDNSYNNSFISDSSVLTEQGMDEYLKNLEAYEDKLAKSEIKW